MSGVRAYAPGRVNLIGEHTDYNGGFALPIALDRGTHVDFDPDPTASSLKVKTMSDAVDAGSEVTISLDTVPGDVGGWGAYVAGCVWALRRRGVDVPGGAMVVTSAVPVGAGLSSSAALECAVVLALSAAAGGPDLDRRTVAAVAHDAENRYVGADTGLLDQLSILHGAVDTAMLIDFRSMEVTPVPIELGDATVMVVDSHSPHSHAAGEYGARRRSCEAAAAALGVPELRNAAGDDWRRVDDPVDRRRARHVLTENSRVLDTAAALTAGDLDGVGRLMVESHASMRDDFEITTSAIDEIVRTALGAGAHGARMTGGGFGGSVVVLASAEAAAQIEADLPEQVERSGHPRPTVARVRAGAGANITTR